MFKDFPRSVSHSLHKFLRQAGRTVRLRQPNNGRSAYLINKLVTLGNFSSASWHFLLIDRSKMSDVEKKDRWKKNPPRCPSVLTKKNLHVIRGILMTESFSKNDKKKSSMFSIVLLRRIYVDTSQDKQTYKVFFLRSSQPLHREETLARQRDNS